MFVLALFYSELGQAQQSFDLDYTPLKCAGPIPKDFLTGAMEQFEMEQEELEAEKSGKANKKEKKFLLSGSYAMSRMLTSGRVLFGDPLTLYCNKVMQRVLVANPSLKHNVRVYVVKSSEVNAFATDQGIILVTVGLLAKLENEAQLAFILSHELVHHLKKHTLDIYFERQDIARGRGEYNQYSIEDRIMQGSIYNKEKEKEADIEGYRYFSNTGYSKAAPIEVMTLLEYSHLPFAQPLFRVSFFEHGGLRFPDLYQLDSIQEVEGTADEEGETHPSIAERLEYLRDQLKGDTLEGDAFLVSEAEFLRTREIARMELCRLYLLEQEYGRAMYSCFILLNKYPDNRYLNVCMAKGLTGLATYATANDERDVLAATARVEGEMQRLYFLLNTLTEKGITVTAVVNNYRLHQKYPEDAEVRRLYHNSIRELAKNYESLSEFEKELPADFESIIDSMRPPENKGKVREEKYNPYESGGTGVSVKTSLTRIERKEIEDRFLKYALVDVLKDEDFVDRFAEQRAGWVMRDDDMPTSYYSQERGQRLGIDSVIMVSPEYVFLRPGLSNPFSISQSIEHKDDLLGRIQEYSEFCGLTTSLIDASVMRSDDLKEFNDLAVLNNWFDELLQRDNNEVMPANQAEVDSIIERYGTHYGCWLAVIRTKDQYARVLRWLNFFGIATGPFMPYFFYKMITPRSEYTTIALLYDLRTGEEVAAFYTNQRLRFNPGAPAAALYDILWQIKTPPR